MADTVGSELINTGVVTDYDHIVFVVRVFIIRRARPASAGLKVAALIAFIRVVVGGASFDTRRTPNSEGRIFGVEYSVVEPPLYAVALPTAYQRGCGDTDTALVRLIVAAAAFRDTSADGTVRQFVVALIASDKCDHTYRRQYKPKFFHNVNY